MPHWIDSLCSHTQDRDEHFLGLGENGSYLLSAPFMRVFKELMLGSTYVLCRGGSFFIAELLARKSI